MTKKELTNFFENYLKRDFLFKNKKAIQSTYIPENIFYRENEINQIAGILAPALKMEKPSNIFLYGKTGSGKTLCIKYVIHNMLEIAKNKDINLKIFYLNCKLKRIADTEYRLMAQLIREFGGEISATGLPTDEVYKNFLKYLNNKKILLIIVLDEIDQLIEKVGDEILYNLTRLNSELVGSEISLIGISNNLVFADNLDPRVKSSLSEEEIIFSPYNATQLQKILKERVKIGFKEDVIEEGLIEKCAAYAAKEHGDARRALELLRVAGELAERSNKDKITIENLDAAEEKVERDRIINMVNSQPKQFKLTLHSIFDMCLNPKKKAVFTGDIYEIYKEICFKTMDRPLTQRRVSDIIAELDMLGIINAKVISKGRYGRTREICLAIPESAASKLNNMLKEGLSL